MLCVTCGTIYHCNWLKAFMPSYLLLGENQIKKEEIISPEFQGLSPKQEKPGYCRVCHYHQNEAWQRFRAKQRTRSRRRHGRKWGVGVHVVLRRHVGTALEREERIASPRQTNVGASLAHYGLLPISVKSHGLTPTGTSHHTPLWNVATGDLPESHSTPGCFCTLDCSCQHYRLSWRVCWGWILGCNLRYNRLLPHT